MEVTEYSCSEVSVNRGCEKEHREVESGASGCVVKSPARLLVALTAKLTEVVSDELIDSLMEVAVVSYLLEIEIVLDAEVWHFDIDATS